MPIGSFPDLPGVVEQAIAPVVGTSVPIGLILAISAPWAVVTLAILANFVRGLVRDNRWR